MYAFLSISLFLVGVALIAVVVIRKIPALVELPKEEKTDETQTRKLTRLRSWFQRIDWQRWQKIFVASLAGLFEVLRKLFIRNTKRAERLARRLRGRVRVLSGGKAEPAKEKQSGGFSARIRKRSAFVEEERRLIEHVAENPQDIEAYRRLGNLYTMAGNIADARAVFIEILKRVPDDEEARKRLVELGGEGEGR